MQRVSLGVLAYTSVALAFGASDRGGIPFERDASSRWSVAAGKCVFCSDTLAESVDPSMAVSRRNLALWRKSRVQAVGQQVSRLDRLEALLYDWRAVLKLALTEMKWLKIELSHFDNSRLQGIRSRYSVY